MHFWNHRFKRVFPNHPIKFGKGPVLANYEAITKAAITSAGQNACSFYHLRAEAVARFSPVSGFTGARLVHVVRRFSRATSLAARRAGTYWEGKHVWCAIQGSMDWEG